MRCCVGWRIKKMGESWDAGSLGPWVVCVWPVPALGLGDWLAQWRTVNLEDARWPVPANVCACRTCLCCLARCSTLFRFRQNSSARQTQTLHSSKNTPDLPRTAQNSMVAV